MNSFEKYLLTIPRERAVDYVIECLISGERNNSAWDLMERMHGEWRCEPSQLPELIDKTIEKLVQEQ